MYTLVLFYLRNTIHYNLNIEYKSSTITRLLNVIDCVPHTPIVGLLKGRTF